jgi:hypothetical protein
VTGRNRKNGHGIESGRKEERKEERKKERGLTKKKRGAEEK